ncbi:MAG: TlpA family protein disulfide reductase, partial [Myxococcales bacterium]|nr:TlpA family protein disulfide reductase [Myxococcales bacterium]
SRASEGIPVRELILPSLDLGSEREGADDVGEAGEQGEEQETSRVGPGITGLRVHLLAWYGGVVSRPKALLALLIFGAGCAVPRRVAPAEPAYGASAGAIESRVHALSEPDLATLLRASSDRPRVVNFWASWCGPCREELPMLERFADSRPDVDVVLVSVDDPRDAAEVARLLAPTRLQSFQLGPDPSAILGRVVADWPRAIPVTLVVDALGGELGRVVGAADARRLTLLLPEIQPAG